MDLIVFWGKVCVASSKRFWGKSEWIWRWSLWEFV